MLQRQDQPFIGTEDIKAKDTQKDLYFEVAVFLLISTGFLAFFISHSHSIKRYFNGNKLDSLQGALIILILSPFGAHLIARVIGFLWEKLRAR